VRHTCDRGSEARHDVELVCCVVSQTDGVTPLQMASMEGHVECVRALLDGGAAIDQATVGCARSMARHCGGYSSWGPWEPCSMHVPLVRWLPSARWRVWGKRWSRPCCT